MCGLPFVSSLTTTVFGIMCVVSNLLNWWLKKKVSASISMDSIYQLCNVLKVNNKIDYFIVLICYLNMYFFMSTVVQ
jgi:hypothetical protein